MFSMLAGMTLAWAVPSDTPDQEILEPAPGAYQSPSLLLDADGDGFSDLLLWYGTDLHRGSAAGLSTAPDQHFAWPQGVYAHSFSSGDFDGDGIDDLVLSGGFSLADFWTEVWSGAPGGLVDQPVLRLEGRNEPAGIGDVDGDGDDELVAVAYGEEIAVYAGDPAGLPATPTWTLPPACDRGAVGLDVNGDGFGDLALGCAPAGLQLFLGSASGLSTAPSDAGFADGLAAYQTLHGGDFDADGFDDLVVLHEQGYKVSVFPGSADGMQPASVSLQLSSSYLDSIDNLTTGDLDGDGDDDLVIGSVRFDGYTGLVALLEGGPAGLDPQPTWTWQGDGQTTMVGIDPMSGDVNGDGVDDLVVGSWRPPSSGGPYAPYRGVAHLFYGVPADTDGDGSPAGTDCDDSDAAVFPEAQEVEGDGLDQNCDGRDALLGLADLAAGDLQITEVMREPTAASGQWFELELTSDATVDLIGLRLGWGPAEAVLEDFLVLSPGDRLVVGVESEVALNGGAPVALALPDLALDTVLQLSTEEVVVDELDLAELPGEPGVAAQRAEGVWCLATRPYGEGDLGTPGQTNDPCVPQSADEPEPPAPASEGCGCQSVRASPAPAVLLLLAWLSRRRPVGVVLIRVCP